MAELKGDILEEALEQSRYSGKRKRASIPGPHTSSPKRMSTRRQPVNADEDRLDLDQHPSRDIEDQRQLRKDLRALSNELQKTAASDDSKPATVRTYTDNSEAYDESTHFSSLRREPIWLFHLLAQFNCDVVPRTLFSRASSPSMGWNSDGELMQIDLDCLNSIYPPYSDIIIKDKSIQWLRRYTSNLKRKEAFHDLVGGLAVSSHDIQLRILILVVVAFPEPWCQVSWEAVEEELWEVVETTCLPLLGVIGMDEIVDFLKGKLSDHEGYYMLTILKFLLRLTLLLKKRTPPNIFTLISQGLGILGKSEMDEVLLRDIEYLRLLKSITDILSTSEKHPHISAHCLRALDHSGSMRSSAAIGFALGSLSPRWLVSANQSEKNELLNWRPISLTAPSTMEILAYSQLLGAISLRDLPNFTWTTLSLDTKVLIAFCEAKKKAFVNAAEILDRNINEAEDQYGPKSLELLLIGIVLVNCWNAIRREVDGEKLGRRIWSNMFGDLNVDTTVEVTHQVYLMVAISDSFLGQGKFDEAKELLNAVLESPTTSDDLTMSATLRLLKINRRLKDLTSLLDDWTKLQKAVQRFHGISDTLKYECIEETVCHLSVLEPKDMHQLSQVPGVVKVLTRYRIEDYQGSAASRINLIQNLEDLHRFKSKFNLFSLSGPQLFYCRKMRERFPSATVPFVEKVASVNWQRSKRINEMREMPQEVQEELVTAKSLFQDSGLGSSIGSDPVVADSPLRRPQEARSITSINSFMSHKLGATLLPPIPPESSSGERICFICEKPLKGVKNGSQWRRHAFGDLRPYVCIVEGCSTEHINFASRTEFAAHLLEHQKEKLWACTHCGHANESKHLVETHFASTHKGLGSERGIVEKTFSRDLSKQTCPFCNEIPGAVKFIGHLCHHLEEISLTAIPRDIEMDEEDGEDSMRAHSVTSTGLLDRMARNKYKEKLRKMMDDSDDLQEMERSEDDHEHDRMARGKKRLEELRKMMDESDDLQEMERSEDDHEHDSEDEYRRVAITDHAGNFQQLTVEEDLGEWERDVEDDEINNALPIIESADEEPYTIKCICNFSDDDGNTVYCETCDTWQHIECYYPGRVEEASGEEFDHFCADCKPRALDRRHAQERQLHQRKMKAMSGKAKRLPSKGRREPLNLSDLRLNQDHDRPKNSIPQGDEPHTVPSSSGWNAGREVTKGEDRNYACGWAGCTEEVRTFTSKAKWSKHMDKHDSPYKCRAKVCKMLPGFTDSGGLLRHEREVHYLHRVRKQFNCPYPNCKAFAGKGFSRQDILNEHLRQVHMSGESDQESQNSPPDSPFLLSSPKDFDLVYPESQRNLWAPLSPEPQMTMEPGPPMIPPVINVEFVQASRRNSFEHPKPIPSDEDALHPPDGGRRRKAFSDPYNSTSQALAFHTPHTPETMSSGDDMNIDGNTQPHGDFLLFEKPSVDGTHTPSDNQAVPSQDHRQSNNTSASSLQNERVAAIIQSTGQSNSRSPLYKQSTIAQNPSQFHASSAPSPPRLGPPRHPINPRFPQSTGSTHQNADMPSIRRNSPAHPFINTAFNFNTDEPPASTQNPEIMHANLTSTSPTAVKGHDLPPDDSEASPK